MRYFTFIVLLVALIGCNRISLPLQTGDTASFSSLEDYIEESPTLQTYFFGMELFDLEENETVFAHQSDQFFSPASVNKWLTLYASTKYLKDSIAWLNVYEVDGKTVYQPLGDPGFMHPKLNTEERILNFFKRQTRDTIHWSNNHFQDQRFGSGWAWDDYTFSYQAEKSAFPIQSNLLKLVDKDSEPSFLAPTLYFDYTGDYPTRLWDENRFYLKNAKEQDWIPYRADTNIVSHYLVEQLKITNFFNSALNESDLVETIYSRASDDLYKVLMQNSDNFIGEQLLLQISQHELGYMNTSDIIDHLQSRHQVLSDEQLYWVDGSGLSRYNMTKPSAIITIINTIVDEKGIEWLKQILPTGGKSGSIKNNYVFNQPRVYAKTGTIRHNHNLAGLVQAKSGKWYSFSMMNNHLPGSSQIAKFEMENILKLIVETY